MNKTKAKTRYRKCTVEINKVALIPKNYYVPCSLLHIEALGKPRRLGLLGASVNKNKYIFFSQPRRVFFKIVCGLYEEMERSDENRSLRNWILARNFLKKLF